MTTPAVELPDAASDRRLAITNRPINELKPDPKNPRSHSQGQVRQIAKSIKTFGFNVPVLVDAADNIVAGHGRLLACRQLGWTTVPTVSLAHLTPLQAKAFLIADNRLTENSEWNDRLLAEQLKELSLLNLDFELDVTGFELAEIDLRIQSLTEDCGEEDDPLDQVPAAAGLAVTQRGDVWLLGRHRLYCGSAIEASAYESLLEGKKAALVFTDPPYNVPVQGHVSGNGAIQHREFAMASGEMTEVQFTGFLEQCCTLLAAHSLPGSIHYVCMDWRHVGELLAAGKGTYSDLLNICVWVKHNGGMGSLYRSQHELVFVFKNGNVGHCNNVQLGKFSRNRTNVWQYRGVNDFGRSTEEGNLLAMHPTVKPVALIADAILDCSRRGDIVLDAFLGSGTTLIACERTGRSCHGIELDPIYVDTAIRRWQRYSGDVAVNTATEQTFDACEETRRNV
ncbi:MAG TPA: DNA methyltransferase [Bradyrhizobium sp.]|nr:DNA methyltransferase [Bradyrhizobium sp.]